VTRSSSSPPSLVCGPEEFAVITGALSQALQEAWKELGR
jgi:hypothetical protein